jgi:hypothetical protein
MGLTPDVDWRAYRVMRNYQHVHHMMHVNARPLKILYYAQESEITLGWVCCQCIAQHIGCADADVGIDHDRVRALCDV